MSSVIQLPGAIDVSGKLSAADLEAAAKRQEAGELDAEIKGRLNFVEPYQPGAPVCDAAITQGAEPVPTRYHGAIQLPAWSYGQCIGPRCVRFMSGLNLCGRKVQDYAAAVALGLLSVEAARMSLTQAALPPEESA